MRDEEWLDLVAGARARHAEANFDLNLLYQQMIHLGMLDVGSGYHAFVDDVRSRAALGGELIEQPDGSWRATSRLSTADAEEVQEEQEEGTPEEEEGGTGMTEVAVQEGEAAAQEEAQQVQDADRTYPRELVVERVGAGQWALWDSTIGQWETIGKEAEAVKAARERGKQADVETRMRVIGTDANRTPKYERVYKPGGRAPRATSKPRKTAGAIAPPTMPGDPAPAMQIAAMGVADAPAPAAQIAQGGMINASVAAEARYTDVGSLRSKRVLLNLRDGRTAAVLPEHVVIIADVPTEPGAVAISLVDGTHLHASGKLLQVIELLEG